MKKIKSIVLAPALWAYAFSADAGLIENGTTEVKYQNYYFSNDFRNEVTSAPDQQSKRAEWAQGFSLDLISGYTPGPIGFGVDASLMYGMKLDSSSDRSGTGLLTRSNSVAPGDPNYARAPNDDYSKAAVTGKIRIGKTDIRIGSLIPTNLPALNANTSRLFPQYFKGLEVQSTDIEKLLLRAGYLTGVMQRDETNFDKFSLFSANNRFSSAAESDQLWYAGLDYKLNDWLTASLSKSELKDIYQQEFFGLKATSKLGNGVLGSELRAFKSSEAGQAKTGDIDNSLYAAMLSYAFLGHTFSGGNQWILGKDAFPVINGANSYIPTEVMVTNFSTANERTWWLRYDYDFAELGAPGLSFTTRYMSGSGAKIKSSDEEYREWERATFISYVVQSGPLRNVSVRYLNGSYRSDLNRGVDQTRFIIGYSHRF